MLCSGSILLAAGLPVLLVFAVMGGLAAVSYVKAAGAVFLGEPRTQDADDAVERPAGMLLPLLIGAVFAFILLFCAPYLIRMFSGLTASLTGLEIAPVADTTDQLAVILAKVAIFSIFFFAVAALLLYLRRHLLPNGKNEKIKPTWDCGYAEPTARMEYTGTAFAKKSTTG